MRSHARIRRYRLEHPPEETPGMRLGRAIHSAVLEPDAFPLEFVVYDGPRRAGKEWDEFSAVNARRTILKREEYETALDVRDAVRAHKAAARLLRRGRTEVTLTWVDPETRIRCKGRLDHLRGGVLTELKTTRDVEARTFGRLATSMGYPEQLAFYRRGIAANGIEPGATYIVAVEAEEPHDVAVYELDEDVLWAADETVGELLRLLVECRRRYRARRWPGRAPDVLPLDVPGWYWDAPQSDAEMVLMGLKEER